MSLCRNELKSMHPLAMNKLNQSRVLEVTTFSCFLPDTGHSHSRTWHFLEMLISLRTFQCSPCRFPSESLATRWTRRSSCGVGWSTSLQIAWPAFFFYMCLILLPDKQNNVAESHERGGSGKKENIKNNTVNERQKHCIRSLKQDSISEEDRLRKAF